MSTQASTPSLVDRLHVAAGWVGVIESHGVSIAHLLVGKRGTILSVDGYERGVVERLVDQYDTPEVVDGTLPRLRWAVADGVVVEVMGGVERYLDAVEPRPVPTFRLPAEVES